MPFRTMMAVGGLLVMLVLSTQAFSLSFGVWLGVAFDSTFAGYAGGFACSVITLVAVSPTFKGIVRRGRELSSE